MTSIAQQALDELQAAERAGGRQANALHLSKYGDDAELLALAHVVTQQVLVQAEIAEPDDDYKLPLMRSFLLGCQIGGRMQELYSERPLHPPTDSPGA